MRKVETSTDAEKATPARRSAGEYRSAEKRLSDRPLL